MQKIINEIKSNDFCYSKVIRANYMGSNNIAIAILENKQSPKIILHFRFTNVIFDDCICYKHCSKFEGKLCIPRPLIRPYGGEANQNLKILSEGMICYKVIRKGYTTFYLKIFHQRWSMVIAKC